MSVGIIHLCSRVTDLKQCSYYCRCNLKIWQLLIIYYFWRFKVRWSKSYATVKDYASITLILISCYILGTCITDKEMSEETHSISFLLATVNSPSRLLESPYCLWAVIVSMNPNEKLKGLLSYWQIIQNSLFWKQLKVFNCSKNRKVVKHQRSLKMNSKRNTFL